MPAGSPPAGGKKVLGMDPLLFWGLLAAFGLGAAYFLLHRSSTGTGQPAAGTGAASGPGLIAADGAPVLYPLGSGQAGSGSVTTVPSGGGTSSGGKQGGGGTGPPTRHPRGVRPKGRAGSGGIMTMAAVMPGSSTQAGSGATVPVGTGGLLPIGRLPVLGGQPIAGGAQLPGVSVPGFLWPFPTKSPSQFRRVDQGWDLQYSPSGGPVPVLAIAPGRVEQLSNPATATTPGFGPAFPGLIFSKPRYGATGVYYGHTVPAPGIVGKQVKAGQVIGYTTPAGNPAYGHTGLPRWLEIGFLGPGGSFPAMGAGSRIRQLLLHAPTAASVRRGKTVQAAPTHRVHLPSSAPAPRASLPLLPPVRRPAAKPKPKPPPPVRNAGRRVR